MLTSRPRVAAAPPDNKPAPAELAACRPFLAAEIVLLQNVRVVVALGRIAFDAVLRVYADRAQPLLPQPLFAHNAASSLGDGQPMLVTSYHPSRQNTQTGRLTVEMFDAVWTSARRLLA